MGSFMLTWFGSNFTFLQTPKLTVHNKNKNKSQNTHLCVDIPVHYGP